jgi:hypothetical protein
MENIQIQIRNHGLTEDLKARENLLKQQLEERRSQEEVLWRQKYRIKWLQEGERNTKFFHHVTIQRRHSNRITHLVTEQGQTLHKHEYIEQELVSYYQDFLSEPPIYRTPHIEKVTQNIPSLITREKNEALSRPITIEEVDSALHDTPVGKAPGPDDFTMDLFFFCWPMICEEVWDIIKDSCISGKVIPALNATFLTLIPKEYQVTHPKQFRPISLCNVIYKLLTKVIAKCLKPLLPNIISPDQSNYVEGRQILDSVILAHKFIHSLQSTDTPGMLLKLYLSKAFDKLSWAYMKSILLAFGFASEWVDWILNLTSSSFFSILINGVPSRPFVPSQGIHQGDPLSPFLFIIMAEGLNRFIKASLVDKSLVGLPLHGMDPPISHS